jgi:hypothetical protein
MSKATLWLMEIVVKGLYYRTRTPERQLEIEECLRRDLNHPGISRVVLLCESDASPVPKGTVPVEVESSDERITYAEWFRWVKRQVSVISLPLTRFNQGRADFDLNDYPTGSLRCGECGQMRSWSTRCKLTISTSTRECWANSKRWGRPCTTSALTKPFKSSR